VKLLLDAHSEGAKETASEAVVRCRASPLRLVRATSDVVVLHARSRAVTRPPHTVVALLSPPQALFAGEEVQVQVPNLPLHYAVINKAQEAVVKALFKAHPEGAKEKGKVCALLSLGLGLPPRTVSRGPFCSPPAYHMLPLFLPVVRDCLP
jgi:hypothetical protein